MTEGCVGRFAGFRFLVSFVIFVTSSIAAVVVGVVSIPGHPQCKLSKELEDKKGKWKGKSRNERERLARKYLLMVNFNVCNFSKRRCTGD